MTTRIARTRSDIPVTLVAVNASDEAVANAARVSTLGAASVHGVDTDRDAGLINFLVRERHGSPFEHNSFTFLVSAPIFVWREHMRHRIGFSYNEESGRYKKLEPEFYVPGPDRDLVQIGKTGAYEFKPGSNVQQAMVNVHLTAAADESYMRYLELLNAGVAREVARMLLPVNIFSSAYVTTNARALMNFLSLRTKADDAHFKSYPQREIEIVAQQYEALFAQHMPMTHAAFCANGRVAP